MKKIFALAAAILFLTSCSKEEKEPEINYDEIIYFQDIPQPNKNGAVSDADLDKVYAALNSSKGQSRSGGYSTSAIFNTNGNPCLYVLNFENGGWALVSATRKYKPIVAFSESGSFELGEIHPDGLEIWQNNLIDIISDVENSVDPDSIAVYESEWECISPET